MELSSATMCPSTAWKVVMLFCIFWPFLAMASVPRRGRSSAPFAAALVALAVIACGIWLDLSNIVGGMAISGAGRESATAGIRDAFAAGSVAVWPLGWIVALSLVLRHRPVADRIVVALGALLCASVSTAWIFAALIAPHIAYILFARAGAAVTLAIAIAAAVRLFVVTRASKNLEGDAALLRERA